MPATPITNDELSSDAGGNTLCHILSRGPYPLLPILPKLLDRQTVPHSRANAGVIRGDVLEDGSRCGESGLHP
ncbi:MAG: hypothetical protein KatS3mg130_2029 [Candidatus Sumerlaea sp.]|jgi:hypothetical protein|nr:MAG: hypothetical protein KatS3mg130_2029 [Candidatus Sumerlaea sp.]